jgi:hypothetical protein
MGDEKLFGRLFYKHFATTWLQKIPSSSNANAREPLAFAAILHAALKSRYERIMLCAFLVFVFS